MHDYTMARKLANSEFIKLLCWLRGMNPTHAEVKRLGIAHTRFINRVQQISKLDSQSKLDLLQSLDRLRELLLRLRDEQQERRSLTCELIRSALSLVDFEQRMIYLHDDETVYLDIFEKDITKEDEVKEYGNQQTATTVDNTLLDPRLEGIETARRKQVCFNLVKEVTRVESTSVSPVVAIGDETQKSKMADEFKQLVK